MKKVTKKKAAKAKTKTVKKVAKKAAKKYMHGPTKSVRTAILFVRLLPKNKAYIAKQAKAHGFKDVAAYLDARTTKERTA